MKVKKRWLVSFVIISIVSIISLFWENKNELQSQFSTVEAINFADVAWLLTSSSFVLLMTPGLS
ncbi:MAG: ammonia channel protein, partial [Flavobacterium sp.]